MKRLLVDSALSMDEITRAVEQIVKHDDEKETIETIIFELSVGLHPSHNPVFTLIRADNQ